MADIRAKQTQFAPGERYRWGKPGPQTRFVASGSPIHPTRGRICAKQTHFSPAGAGRPGYREGQTCETNPILRLRIGTDPRRDAPSHLPPRGPRRRNAQNKPNLHLGRSIGGASPTLRVGAFAPNKPNSARSAGRPGHREGQTCETNPIRRATVPNKANSRPRPGGTGPRGQRPTCKTNPMSGNRPGRPEVPLYKQSQFWQSLPPRRRGMPMLRRIDGRCRGRGCQIGTSIRLARDRKCLSGISLAVLPVRHGFC